MGYYIGLSLVGLCFHKDDTSCCNSHHPCFASYAKLIFWHGCPFGHFWTTRVASQIFVTFIAGATMYTLKYREGLRLSAYVQPRATRARYTAVVVFWVIYDWGMICYHALLAWIMFMITSKCCYCSKSRALFQQFQLIPADIRYVGVMTCLLSPRPAGLLAVGTSSFFFAEVSKASPDVHVNNPRGTYVAVVQFFGEGRRVAYSVFCLR